MFFSYVENKWLWIGARAFWIHPEQILRDCRSCREIHHGIMCLLMWDAHAFLVRL